METTVNEISINGQTYVPKGSQVIEQKPGAVKIVILQRGWVMVGYYRRDGDNCSLTNASVIRTWGTTKGLGEIAKDGPKSSTTLDPTNGLVEFHRLTEVAAITCNESKWSKHLV